MAIETYSYIVPNELRDSPTFAASNMGTVAEGKLAAQGKKGPDAEVIRATVGDIFEKPSAGTFNRWVGDLYQGRQAAAFEQEMAKEKNIDPAYDFPIGSAELSYAGSQGTLGLRTAVAKDFSEETKIPVTADNVAVGNGGKGALNGVVRYLKRGEKVLVASTGWPTNYDMFPPGVEIIEINSHGRGLLTPEEWQEAFDRFPDARMALINSPCNPTGNKYSPEEREKVFEIANAHAESIAEKRAMLPDGGRNYSYGPNGEKTEIKPVGPDFQVVLDNPYGKITFDGTTQKRGPAEQSAFARGHATEVRSMSKEYGMAGTRVGFAISKNNFIIGHVKKFNETFGGLPNVTQVQAQAAIIHGGEYVKRNVADLEKKRDALVDGLCGNSEKGIKPSQYLTMERPDSTIYGWVNGKKLKGMAVSAEDDLDGKGYIIEDDRTMMKFLVEVARVNPVPGKPFYAPRPETKPDGEPFKDFATDDMHFRFCFSGNLEKTKQACEQIKEAEGRLRDPQRHINNQLGQIGIGSESKKRA